MERAKVGTKECDLRNHFGVSVAFSNGCSVAFSNGSSHVSGMFQRIVTFPMDCHWKCPMDVQRQFPIEFHLCYFWRVIVCPVCVCVCVFVCVCLCVCVCVADIDGSYAYPVAQHVRMH